jgi:hypothetical protein
MVVSGHPHSTAGERALHTYWIGSQVGSTAGLEVLEKSPVPSGIQTPDCPVHSLEALENT